MKITSVEQVREFEILIGAQNAKACKRALDDGAELWIFKDLEGISKSKLKEKEKKTCIKLFKENGFAGWFRPPKRTPIPGCDVHPNMDAHGNMRNGGSGSSSNWSH